MSRRLWTQEDNLVLIDLFPNSYTRTVGEKLARSYSSVVKQAHKLGLKKTPEFIERMLKETSAHLPKSGIKTRFKKGDPPYYKGRKIPPEIKDKCRHTYFPKGNIPHNSANVGDIVSIKGGYLKIKIAEPNQWQLLHRHVWQQKNGLIPEGYRIWFKDKDTTNCDLSNLELITDKEAMDRNRITDLPPELQQVIKLKNKLNKKIKENGKK
ncbi:MAG: HNH endonuclease [Flavobacteriia bacterium]|nr:HNH endonuclease [Flavobacteriia bacterium]OJX36673.1 MAG: hypothetical protein BGO87_12815 [Flavobacteriia bacterium 40-80]